MDALVALIVLVLVGLVAWVVVAPMMNGAVSSAQDARLAAFEELQAEKEAKYREIRDAELDHRTGKLSEEDWKAIDRQLRAEAIDVLRRIDRLGSD